MKDVKPMIYSRHAKINIIKMTMKRNKNKIMWKINPNLLLPMKTIKVKNMNIKIDVLISCIGVIQPNSKIL